jgi:hypothetical protein
MAHDKLFPQRRIEATAPSARHTMYPLPYIRADRRRMIAAKATKIAMMIGCAMTCGKTPCETSATGRLA